ncbi:MAG: GNAT family N-acetyltransferase [Candidatus Thiodiazotropha sp. (ex Gloverina cf. vestifex)]|nr:GNAT family N-acetyltransferase [Candidatus Thiodiazotropha sp. (ex Gloverina cf. vestifex)]
MTGAEYTIREAIWPEDRQYLRQVREPVFVEEQGVPLEIEWDDDDLMAYHLLALDRELRPIGTARLLGSGQIGRMAVLPEWRGRGIGRTLLDRILTRAEASGITKLFLHAQTDAEAFYAKAGFTAVGKIFHEADIPHRKMVLHPTAFNSVVDLTLPVLGGTSDLFHLHNEEENLVHATSLLRQAKRELAIISHDLDHKVFDQPAFLEAFKALALRSRFTRIQIILQDNTLVLQQGHRLVELAQRLPSVIEIRKPSQDFIDTPETFLLVDDCGYLHRKAAESYLGIACYHNRHRVNRLLALFNDAWETGTPDRELARLHL